MVPSGAPNMTDHRPISLSDLSDTYCLMSDAQAFTSANGPVNITTRLNNCTGSPLPTRAHRCGPSNALRPKERCTVHTRANRRGCRERVERGEFSAAATNAWRGRRRRARRGRSRATAASTAGPRGEKPGVTGSWSPILVAAAVTVPSRFRDTTETARCDYRRSLAAGLIAGTCSHRHAMPAESVARGVLAPAPCGRQTPTFRGSRRDRDRVVTAPPYRLAKLKVDRTRSAHPGPVGKAWGLDRVRSTRIGPGR